MAEEFQTVIDPIPGGFEVRERVMAPENPCQACNGEGVVDCEPCLAVGYDPIMSANICKACSGRGHQWCATCGGKGVASGPT